MKKTRNITLISEFLIFAILTLIVFLTIPDKRLDSNVFWLGFAFAIPVNYLVATMLTVFGISKKGVDIVSMPIAFWLMVSFGAAYLFFGIIFMYFGIEKLTFPIILEIVISVCYIIACMYLKSGANNISDSSKEVREKVIYIKMLEADVNDCMAKATDSESVCALRALSDDIRYSDPMSNPSLAGIEAQLSSAVAEISSVLYADSSTDVTALVSKCQALLKSRNDRCKMLKT